MHFPAEGVGVPEGTLGPANRSEAASQSPSMARIKYRLWRPVQAGMLWEQWMEQIPLPSQCSPDLDLCRREAFSALFTGDFVFFYSLAEKQFWMNTIRVISNLPY